MVSVTKGRVVNSNYAVHRFQNTNVTVITPVSFEKGRGQKKKKKLTEKVITKGNVLITGIWMRAFKWHLQVW